MARPRLIPVLLLDANGRLVKTVRFGTRTYVGDPLNVVRLFNEKEVDEIIVLDIDATPGKRTPDFGLIRELASECFMPIAYGGGISTVEQCEKINRAGIEKFVLGASTRDAGFVREACTVFGSQAVVGCVDVVGDNKAARCVTHSGKSLLNTDPMTRCLELQECGVGEIVLQSVDRDGTRGGYDFDLIARVARNLTIPLVALGGAGDFSHLVQALKAGASAAASGSAFTFIGRLRAVLISYPALTADDILTGGRA